MTRNRARNTKGYAFRPLQLSPPGNRVNRLPLLAMTAGILLLSLVVARPLAAGKPAGTGSASRLSGEVIVYTLNTADSQHFVDYWTRGHVVLAHGDSITDVMLMYNGYLDELIWMHPTTYNTIKVDKGLVRAFSLYLPDPPDTVEFRNIMYQYWYQTSPVNAYATPLYSGSLSLMLRHKISKAGERSEYTAAGRSIRTLLKPTPEYFLTLPSGLSYPVQQFRRNTFMHIFPEHHSEVRQAFRQFTRKELQYDMGKAMFVETLDALISQPGF